MSELNREAVDTEIRNFMEKWNAGDIEGACTSYTDDASFLLSGGLIRGKTGIIERYRSSYPNKEAMGELTVDVLEFRPASGENPTMASVFIRWHLKLVGGAKNGYSHLTYVLQDGEALVLNDTSI